MGRPFYFSRQLPAAGLTLFAGVPADGAPGYTWRIIGDGHKVLAKGAASCPRGALVSLRWSLTSILERTAQDAGRSIESAIEGIVS